MNVVSTDLNFPAELLQDSKSEDYIFGWNPAFIHSDCRLMLRSDGDLPLEIRSDSHQPSDDAEISPQNQISDFLVWRPPVTCPDVLCLSAGFSVRHLTGRLCQEKYKAAYILNDVEAI
jgi:hypothetical protein